MTSWEGSICWSLRLASTARSPRSSSTSRTRSQRTTSGSKSQSSPSWTRLIRRTTSYRGFSRHFKTQTATCTRSRDFKNSLMIRSSTPSNRWASSTWESRRKLDRPRLIWSILNPHWIRISTSNGKPSRWCKKRCKSSKTYFASKRLNKIEQLQIASRTQATSWSCSPWRSIKQITKSVLNSLASSLRRSSLRPTTTSEQF